MCCLLEGRKKTRDLSGLTSFTSIEEPTYEHQPHIRPKTKCPQQQGVRLFDNCSNSIQYCLFYSICKLTRKLLLRVLASVVRACLAFLCWFFNASKRSEAAVRPLRSLVFSRPSSKQHITTVDWLLQLYKYETAPYFFLLNRNLTWDRLLTFVFLPECDWFCLIRT